MMIVLDAQPSAGMEAENVEYQVSCIMINYVLLVMISAYYAKTFGLDS